MPVRPANLHDASGKLIAEVFLKARPTLPVFVRWRGRSFFREPAPLTKGEIPAFKESEGEEAATGRVVE